ncbi:UvrD-helicase domain-containing protein [Corynebacterium epidermidicanis]|uniref:DNA 3'-5' helicase n=1 Tax=Corynebacterium epidermidicanis TaxID=1050174 RepID=A0A0G3GW26_9CORY|nr:UvrD-helicase domain-containing protein [Corynebacterium epidermidicanis]AKK03708.1 hypothetical protein CEPID_09310 [Corynebacterium epidermidicanis]
MHTLNDQPARDRIRTGVHETLFVEAGAGAGKTTNLIGRLLTLILEHKVPVSQIAAITFTKKAAAELSEKLASELSKHENNPIAERALLELPSAAFETLHSFCQRLLQLYPLEAGIPPEIEVQDSFAEARQSRLLKDRINDAFTRALEGTLDIAGLSQGKVLDDDLQAAIHHVADTNVTMESIFELASYMDDNWGELRPTLNATLPEEYTFDAGDAERIVLSLREKLNQCTDTADLFAVNLSNQINALEQRIANQDFTDVGDFTKGRGGSKKNWGGADVAALKAECAELFGAWNSAVEKQNARPRAVLRYVLALLVIEHARARHRSGKLQFNDLVYLADELLATNADVRADTHQRFTHLLVDEFQDTDPAQFRIVTAIATDPTTGAITPGALFTVGDPKQSIYRFRHADLDTYLKARAENPEGLVELKTNFRSTAKVLNWANDVFSEYFANASDLAESKVPKHLHPLSVDFTPLDALTDAPGEHSHVFTLAYDDDKEEGISAKDAEAAAIEGAIQLALTQQWQKRTPNGLANLQLGDIAILVRTHAHAANLMQYFDKVRLPYIAESATLTYLATEIEEFHTVVHAVADPAESLSVGAALRTSLLGISDLELAEWATTENKWSPFQPDLDKRTDRVSEALKTIRDLHFKSRRMPVDEFISMAIDTLALPQLAAAYGDFPIEALRRLEFVKHNARAFTTATHGTLREYSEWADALANERHQLKDPEATAVNAVRILTLHAAKGREFPFVILAGMYAQKNSNPPQRSFHPADHVLEYHIGKLASPRADDIKLYNKLADDQETARLFYVAATRAEDHLVVGRYTKTKTNSTAHALNVAIENTQKDAALNATDLPATEYTYAMPLSPTLPAETSDTLAISTAQWQNAEHPRQAATALAHRPETHLELDPSWEVAFHERAHHGKEQGTALHWIMEHAGTAPLAELVQRTAVSTTAQAELLTMATTLMESDIVTKAFASDHYRELPIFGTVDEHVVDGVIDLLYREDDAWVIADYKTDLSATSQTVGEYFLQLSYYARLLGEDFPVKRLELLFPKGKQVVVRSKDFPGA